MGKFKLFCHLLLLGNHESAGFLFHMVGGGVRIFATFTLLLIIWQCLSHPKFVLIYICFSSLLNDP